MLNRKDIRLFGGAGGLVLTGITLCLLLGLWLFGSSGKQAEAHTAGPADVPLLASARPSTGYAIFLPLVARNYTPPVPTVFGVQLYGDLSNPAAGITLSQEAHVYWGRWPLAWSAIEPVDTLPANYDFGNYDSSILSATQAGLYLVVTIVGNPSWAATYPQGPIDKVDIGKFTEFVGTAVERYDGDGRDDAPGSPVVDYWEFYNEPDGGDRLRAEYGGIGYWGHYGAQYAQMLCTVYPVIKAANPRAKVVLGGLAYDWFEDGGGPFVREFIDDVLNAGGGQCFDIMNFHYYPAFESQWATYGAGLSGKANYLRNKLQQYALNKPMICTEAGWPSDIYGSTPEIQTRYVVKLFAQSQASSLGLMTWWTWIDPAPAYGAFGLLTQNLERKPSFNGYRAAAEKIGRASFQRALSSAELGSTALEGYLFASPNSLYVLWSKDEVTRTVTLSLSRARVTNLYGEIIGEINDGDDGQTDGFVQVSVGPNPIYVEAIP